MRNSTYATFAAIAAMLTLVVVVFGAYVRLSDAGLGCPDWPGCYGHVGVPETPEAIAQAKITHPDSPVEPAKAWKEMIHRYLASGLGLLILMLAITAWVKRNTGLPVILPTILVGLVIFQGLLGMWTVTMLVKPLVVTAHLIGGLTTLMLLWWLSLRTGQWFTSNVRTQFTVLRPWLIFGMIILILQVILGGWTSTTYSAAACVEFPTCYGGMWWPTANFQNGFDLFHGMGSMTSYEGGALDNAARVAIQLTHRIAAVIVFFYLIILSLQVMTRAASAAQVTLGVVLHLLLIAQVVLGIAVVLNFRQLEVAVGHNAGAALLLVTLLTLIHIATSQANNKARAA